MPTSKNPQRLAKMTSKSREVTVAAFWEFCSKQDSLMESERLIQIKEGFPAHLAQAVRVTFDLQKGTLETLFNASYSTLERCWRGQKPLDPVASERLDRIAAVCLLAEEIFESREATARWMSTPNKALGGSRPVSLCVTEIGAKQARRVLHALESGGGG